MESLTIDSELMTIGGMLVAGLALLWFGKIVAKTAAIVIGACLGLAAVGLLFMALTNGEIPLPF